MPFRTDYFGRPSSVNSQSLQATLYCCLDQLCGLYLKLATRWLLANPSELTLQNWTEIPNGFGLGGTVRYYWASTLTSNFLGEPQCSKVRGLDTTKCVVAWGLSSLESSYNYHRSQSSQ